MHASSICTEINRLFGDMTRDDAAALTDMRLIAQHAAGMAAVLESERAFEDDFDDDDFEDEGDDYFDDDLVDDGSYIFDEDDDFADAA